jgi:hypothetical protein
LRQLQADIKNGFSAAQAQELIKIFSSDSIDAPAMLSPADTAQFVREYARFKGRLLSSDSKQALDRFVQTGRPLHWIKLTRQESLERMTRDSSLKPLQASLVSEELDVRELRAQVRTISDELKESKNNLSRSSALLETKTKEQELKVTSLQKELTSLKKTSDLLSTNNSHLSTKLQAMRAKRDTSPAPEDEVLGFPVCSQDHALRRGPLLDPRADCKFCGLALAVSADVYQCECEPCKWPVCLECYSLRQAQVDFEMGREFAGLLLERQKTADYARQTCEEANTQPEETTTPPTKSSEERTTVSEQRAHSSERKNPLQPLEWISQTQPCQLFEVDPNSQEFKDVVRGLVADIEETLKNDLVVVSKVERIQNKGLWLRYAAPTVPLCTHVFIQTASLGDQVLRRKDTTDDQVWWQSQ